MSKRHREAPEHAGGRGFPSLLSTVRVLVRTFTSRTELIRCSAIRTYLHVTCGGARDTAWSVGDDDLWVSARRWTEGNKGVIATVGGGYQ